MKELINGLIPKLHFIVLLFGLYSTWVMYDEHQVQLQDIVNQNAGLDDEIIVSTKKVKEIQDFVKKADEYKVRVEEVVKNIESVQRQLPAETNDTQILSFFQTEINALNIKDASFTPGKEEPAQYFISKEYGLKAQGTFLQFLIFFERIGTADRIYNVKNLKLTISNDGKKGRFQMISGEGTIEAFRFNPDFKVERGLPPQ